MQRTDTETLQPTRSNALVNAARAGASYYFVNEQKALILSFSGIEKSDTGKERRVVYFNEAVDQLKAEIGLAEKDIDRNTLRIRLEGTAKDEIASQLKKWIEPDDVEVSSESDEQPAPSQATKPSLSTAETSSSVTETPFPVQTNAERIQKRPRSTESSSEKKDLPGVTLSALLKALPARPLESVEVQEQEILSLQKKLQLLSPATFEVAEGEPNFEQTLKQRLGETPTENQPALLAQIRDDLVANALMKGDVHIAKPALQNGVNLTVPMAGDTHRGWEKRTIIIASILTDYVHGSEEKLTCNKGKIFLKTKQPTELSECLTTLAQTQPQREKQ